jgi:hypothetical protein
MAAPKIAWDNVTAEFASEFGALVATAVLDSARKF